MMTMSPGLIGAPRRRSRRPPAARARPPARRSPAARRWSRPTRGSARWAGCRPRRAGPRRSSGCPRSRGWSRSPSPGESSTSSCALHAGPPSAGGCSTDILRPRRKMSAASASQLSPGASPMRTALETRPPGIGCAYAAGASTPSRTAKPPEGLHIHLQRQGPRPAGSRPARPKLWAVEKGVIVCKGGGGGWLLTEKEYGDFEFRCEYRWSKEGGNSGVGSAHARKGDPAYVGMEIQLIDDENWEKVRKSKLADYQHTGSIYDVQPAKQASEQADRRVEHHPHRLQGPQGDDRAERQGAGERQPGRLQGEVRQAPRPKREKGHVGFQSYNIRVEFRTCGSRN